MDKFEVDKWRSSVPVIIERYGKENLYGGIVRINAESINNATAFWVLENQKKQQFDETQDTRLFTSVPYDEIKNIKPQIEMKTKLIGDGEIYIKQKDLAIAIIEKFGGSIVINVNHYIDDREKMNKELYINFIQIRLPYNIEVYISNDIDNNLTAEFNLKEFEDNNKSQDIIYKLKALLMNNRCKTM
jgi:hypothetical protein